MTDFTELKKRIEEDAALTEEALKNFLAPQDADYLPLFDSMRYSTLNGGKRIRAFLVIEFCRMMNKDVAPALPFAAAMEMMHAFSLIHDDLPCMDDDDMRRGKPSNHVVFGEAGALLSGDALMIVSVETAANNEFVRPKTALRAVRDLTAFAGRFGMAGGQQLDLIGETKKLDYETLLKMHACKTGALIKAACRLGCYATDQYDDAMLSAADTYAEKIGLAFQIIDDILDVTADEKELGKHIGKDKDSGKTTFMTYMSVEEARDYAAKLTQEAVDAISVRKKSGTLAAFAEYLLVRNH